MFFIIDFCSAPPPSGNQPVIIEQKKSNTCCIVTLVLCCLCVVLPIIIVVVLFATAVSTISNMDLTIPTQPPAGPSGNIPQDKFNLIFKLSIFSQLNVSIN